MLGRSASSMAEGVRMGVNGTPTFIIDGERFDGRLARHRAARGGDREAAASSTLVAAL